MRILTGIQSSGDLHIGNYFGSIKQMIDSQGKNEVFAFIANYHAMTSVHDGERLASLTMQAAIDFNARVNMELLANNEPCRVKLRGPTTDAKEAQANRVRQFQNYK